MLEPVSDAFPIPEPPPLGLVMPLVAWLVTGLLLVAVGIALTLARRRRYARGVYESIATAPVARIVAKLRLRNTIIALACTVVAVWIALADGEAFVQVWIAGGFVLGALVASFHVLRARHLLATLGREQGGARSSSSGHVVVTFVDHYRGALVVSEQDWRAAIAMPSARARVRVR